MKKILSVLFLTVAVVGLAESKTRWFLNGKPLSDIRAQQILIANYNAEANYQIEILPLVCTTDAEWNNSGCPDNIIVENGAVRFKTAQEKQADILTAQQTAILKETTFGKLEIREVFDGITVQADPKVTLGDLLTQVLESNPKFKTYWNDADRGIDITYPTVVEALASFPVQLDITALKLAILANRLKKGVR